MRYRAVLFDLDGTLVDSAPLIRAGLRAALIGVGLPVPDAAELSACIGLPLPHVWNRLGVAVARRADAEAAYRAWASAGGQPLAAAFPGIPELLRDLHAAGVVLVLATAKDQASAERALRRHGWQELFRHAAGAWPDDGPDKRALVARALAGLPDRGDAVMVGDMAVDGDAAARAGIPFVAVDWGCGESAAIAAQRPVLVARSVEALRAWLLPGERG